MSRKLNVITCPKCGREYMPAEIFIPKNLLGAPSVIKRNADGKIEDFIGTDMDLNERYCCDSCNTVFGVVADISFRSSVDARFDIMNDYSSEMGPKFTLVEY